LYDTVRANGMHEDVHARLMVTRGPKREPFQDPRLSREGAIIVIIAEFSAPAAGVRETGLPLHTVPVLRGLPVTQDPKLNSHSKLNCILAGIHAIKTGADEALMLDPHGFVNTANSTNFFIVRRGEVWTSTGASSGMASPARCSDASGNSTRTSWRAIAKRGPGVASLALHAPGRAGVGRDDSSIPGRPRLDASPSQTPTTPSSPSSHLSIEDGRGHGV